MNKFVELAITKQKMIDGIDEQIHFEVVQMIKQTLVELYLSYSELFDGAFIFKVSNIEFFLSHRKGDYHIKFMLHNMVQTINIMNHDISQSDRIGTGLEQYYFKDMLVTQLEKVYGNDK